MKMPHVDDHTLRSAHSPHHHPEERAARHPQSYYYDKRASEAEMSPHVSRREAYSPSQWRYPHHHAHEHDDHQSMDSTTGSRGSTFQGDPSSSAHANTPPASPHVPPRYDYSSAYPESHPSYYRGGPAMPPYSQRGGGGGYSYYHHHPNSRPPMMPRDMHYPPYHPDMSPPPPSPYRQTPYPHPHSMPPPRFETPPLTPSATTSYYHDQQYPNFLPPSASITTTASSASGSTMSPSSPSLVAPRGEGGEEDYYYAGGDAHGSPRGATEVNQVGPNDVLCGRGAPTNYHPGNEFFRELVKEYQSTYLSSKRADKPFVASHIVNIIQSRGGRFLRRYKRNGVSWERGHFVWVEVDPQKAYEKACQALREGAPEIRRKMAESGSTCSDDDDGAEEDTAAADNRTPKKTASNKDTATQDVVGERHEKENEKENSPSSSSTSADESNKKPAAAVEPNEDDRNDEMPDSERS